MNDKEKIIFESLSHQVKLINILYSDHKGDIRNKVMRDLRNSTNCFITVLYDKDKREKDRKRDLEEYAKKLDQNIEEVEKEIERGMKD